MDSMQKRKMDSMSSDSFRYVADPFWDEPLTSASPRHLVDTLGWLLVSFGIHSGDTVALAIGGCHSSELCFMIRALLTEYGAKVIRLPSAAHTQEVLEQHLSQHETKLLLTGPVEDNQTVASAAATAVGVPYAIVSLDLSSGRVAIPKVVDRGGVPLVLSLRCPEIPTSMIPVDSVEASVQSGSAEWGSPDASAGVARGSVAAPQSEPPHSEAAAVRAETSGMKLKDALEIAAGAVTAVKGDVPLFFFYVAIVFFSMSEVFKIKLGRFHEFLKRAGTFLIFCGVATHVITTLPPAFRYTAMAITFTAVAVGLAMFVPLSRTPRGDRPPPPSTALDARLSGGINDTVADV